MAEKKEIILPPKFDTKGFNQSVIRMSGGFISFSKSVDKVKYELAKADTFTQKLLKPEFVGLPGWLTGLAKASAIAAPVAGPYAAPKIHQ